MIPGRTDFENRHRIILEELLARTRSFGLDAEHLPSYVSSIFVRRHAELRLVTQ